MELNETIRWKERRSSTCPVVLATNPSDAKVVIGSPFICGAAADLADLQDRAFPLATVRDRHCGRDRTVEASSSRLSQILAHSPLFLLLLQIRWEAKAQA